MKSREIVPNDHERILPVNRYILSTTDRSGRITSVNDLFIEHSGFSEDELLGMQHNIVRHPDMPRAVFWLAWDMLSAGEEFHGYIKNLCKDGAYYWVFSHILPITGADGEVAGYRSVRRHAKRDAVVKVAALYADMLAAERTADPKDAIQAGLNILSAHLARLGMSYEEMVAKL